MDPFLAEIRIFAGDFAPKGWAQCNGQLMPIGQNTKLFSLLGTTYGGNGQTTFALPNLQGKVPMHPGDGPGLTHRERGEEVGSNSVTLITTQMPAHNHIPMADGNEDSAAVNVATSNEWGTGPRGSMIYSADATRVAMSPLALGLAGGTLPHNNMQPYLGLTFIIALEGLFPPRSD